jgi:Fibronectin type III domain
VKRRGLQAIIAAILLAPLFAPPATALVNERESTVWGHIFAGQTSVKTYNATTNSGSHLQEKSKIEVTYNNFPAWAQTDIQAAVDVWAANFESSVPIKVDATWGRSQVYGLLGSARPGNYFNNFVNAPDPTLWYPSALANALAGRDLDKNNPEIVIQVNSAAPWDTRNDGKPSLSEYDLQSVFIHEIGHGLGFLSTDSYDPFFGFGSIDQPTPFDAYLQLEDGRRLSDLPSPSIELGRALTNTLVWSGAKGIAANGGVKPKIYTPSRYANGSSVSHLDESTFANSGLNSVMTPNLDAGEVFREPGSLLLGMMEDMRNKPPAGIAVGIPNVVRNLQVLVGDSSAIITFDPPTNVRSAQVTSYAIKNIKSGVTTYANTSPFTVTGLKNGTSYTFSISAINNNGTSDSITTEPVTPVATWKTSVIDNASDAKFLVSSTLNNQPFIAYISSKTGTLRSATYANGIWKKVVIDGLGGTAGRTNHKLGGHLSLCTAGTGTRQIIHLFYGDTADNDLRHATITPTSYTFEVVDGNAPSIQSYDQPARVRTGSDVSYSSACVATSTVLQVFYRDESQGVLLGAVKKSNKWSYELIDGDRKTDGRTTGDVAFHLDAYLNGSTTYLIYDSVLVVNQKKDATAGEIRLASRDGSSANTWIYQTLDSPSTSASVLGYDVAINKVGGKLTGGWLAASGATLPNPSQVRTQVIDGALTTYSTSKFGTPNAPLNLNGTTMVLSCQKRLCAIDTITKKITLISGWQSDDPIQNGWITLNGVRYLVAGINGQLVALAS